MAEEREIAEAQEMPDRDGEKTTILHSSQMKNRQCQRETLGIVAFMQVAFMQEAFDIPVR